MLSKISKPVWLLIIIGFLLYFPSFSNGFVWDDEELILNNSEIRSLSNIPAFFLGSTFNSGGGTGGFRGTYYRPMMLAAFSLTNLFFGDKAFGFHFVQIIVHVINGVLTYLILFYIFKKRDLALGIALLFLVHPLNVEAVSYLAATQEVLFYFFAALSFCLILNNRWWGVFFILPSLLAKETGAVFATIILFYLFLFEKPKLKKYLIGIVIVVGFYFLLRFGVARVFFTPHDLAHIANASLINRLITIPRIISYYLGNFVIPINMGIDQQWVERSINFKFLILNLLFLSILSYLGYLSYLNNKFKLWLFFFVWFVLGLGFHLQLFPLDMTVADRWLYLAIPGLLGCIFLSFKFEWIIVVILALYFIIFTFTRQLDWHDGLSLYSKDVTKVTDSFDLENNYGVELFRAGRMEEAKIHFARSTEILPKWWTNWNNLGAIYEQEGDLAKAEESYLKSMKNGVYYRAYQNYAKLLYKTGRTQELKEFLEKDGLVKLPYNPTLRQLQQIMYNQ